jgi:hypothetical protein
LWYIFRYNWFTSRAASYRVIPSLPPRDGLFSLGLEP